MFSIKKYEIYHTCARSSLASRQIQTTTHINQHKTNKPTTHQSMWIIIIHRNLNHCDRFNTKILFQFLFPPLERFVFHSCVSCGLLSHATTSKVFVSSILWSLALATLTMMQLSKHKIYIPHKMNGRAPVRWYKNYRFVRGTCTSAKAFHFHNFSFCCVPWAPCTVHRVQSLHSIDRQ